MPNVELTQIEYERAELEALKARRRFLQELAKHPELMKLYAACHHHERLAVDARRARRESEVHEGGHLAAEERRADLERRGGRPE